jgi:predicted PurR-regulated permease PerM
MPITRDKAATVGIVVLATVTAAGALYLARDFFVPIALSLLFAVLLRPLVRRFEKARVPTPIGAAVVLIVVVGVLTIGIAALTTPARQWIADAPQRLKQAEGKLRKLRQPFQKLSKAADQVQGVVTGGAGQGGEADAAKGGQAGQSAAPSASSAPPLSVGSAFIKVFGTTTGLVLVAAQVLLLTFLLMASGDLFLEKLLRVLPRSGERSAAIKVTREVEEAVSRYMLANVFINLGQGIVVALAVALIGLPSPPLWGVLTFVCEFVPYIGAALMIFLLSVAGLASSNSVGHAVLAPLAYLFITTLQNNLVSPVAYGRHLRLNPVAVLIGVLFWWFLWGVPGAFLAVPLIATAKILGDHVRGLSALGEFLAG